MSKNTTKKVSINKLEKIIKLQTKNYPDESVILYDIGDEKKVEITVKYTISINEMSDMVNAIVNALFLNDKYQPALYKMLYSQAILGTYTNLKTDINNEILNSIVYKTDIIEKIVKKINEIQLTDIKIAIDKAIDFKQKSIISTQEKLLEDNLKQLTVLTDNMSKLEEQFKDIDINKVMETYNKIGKTSEKEIVNNVLDYKEMKEKTENTSGD